MSEEKDLKNYWNPTNMTQSYKYLYQQNENGKDYRNLIEFNVVTFGENEPYARDITWKQIVKHFGKKNVIKKVDLEGNINKKRRISDSIEKYGEQKRLRYLSSYLPDKVVSDLEVCSNINLESDWEYIDKKSFIKNSWNNFGYEEHCADILAFVIKKVMLKYNAQYETQ